MSHEIVEVNEWMRFVRNECCVFRVTLKPPPYDHESPRYLAEQVAECTNEEAAGAALRLLKGEP